MKSTEKSGSRPGESATGELLQRLTELESTVTLLEVENRYLRKKAQKADSANRAKSDFLAMISHEIRTPMNGVIGITELLLNTKLEARQKYFAELILSSARNLLTLINSLLDFSKIEANKMILEVEQFDLADLLTEIMALYEVSGQQKGLFVSAEIDPTLEPFYLGDSYRIRQILVNLLGNAIKFTDRGGVQLKVRVEKRAEQEDLLRFEITDTGLGIVPEKLDRLFLPFSQVDSSTTRRHGGTGLGLSICSKLVELMGGSIHVQSESGRGSRFWFVLSLPRLDGIADIGHVRHGTVDVEAQGEVLPLLERSGPRVIRPSILIVDDDETNRVLMEQTFRKTNASLAMATNGRDAVELCRETAFDIIFMDCQMPQMDGFEAAIAISEQAKPLHGKRPVIIALTADVTRTTRKRCREVGMDDYLAKPLDFSELQRVLDNWLTGFALHVAPRHHLTGSPVISANNEVQPVVVKEKNIEQLRQNIGDIRPVIKVFLSTMRERLDDLEQAIREKDAAIIQRTAHTLKGSSSQFGAEELAAICLQMENMGKQNNLQQIEPLFKKIVRAADRVAYFLHEQLD